MTREAEGLADRAGELRPEDAFDVAAVHSWLAEKLPDLPAELPEVRQFPGGASNLTYSLDYPASGQSPGLSLILRRPPRGTKAKSAHDMSREYLVQDRLRASFGLVPRMIGLCTDAEVIGSDFYVMQRLDGIILRRDPPQGLTLDAPAARRLSQDAVDVLVRLHRVDVEAAGLTDLGRGPGYVGRQVDGWSRRFRAARTDNVPDFEAVMAWLAAEQPQDVGMCLIHGDYRLDNLVLDAHGLGIVGVLDWELSTVGDPLMDLGNAMAYWVQADDDAGMQVARRQPTNLPGMLSRREFVDRYCTAMDLSADRWPFYEVYGLFRVAVIVQQIYFRYHHGQTTNPAFAQFWQFTHYLDQRCRDIIAAS
jgi:aminoglycoside phosphotransferase (APT) family kinase protein